MKEGLKRPGKLKEGDLVTTISLSSGLAGEEAFRWRYDVGVKRLEEVFRLRVTSSKNALNGIDDLYHHPEKRAQDLMEAFSNPEIKGIFSCIGGYESIRMLPFIDFDVISSNPKIFMGYSDTTITHLICHKAGITSYYGPAVLVEFAENVEMHDYTKKWVEKALFSEGPIGRVEASDYWTGEYLPWEIKNKDTQRKLEPSSGYELLQGSGDGKPVQGRLLGGCIEVLEMAKGTSIWPSIEEWRDSILFFETSEDMPSPVLFEAWLRYYGSQGILQVAKGILFGKPYENKYYNEYKEAIQKVVIQELGLKNLPILLNMNFGHTAPMTIIPYGYMAEIDPSEVRFSILE